MPKDAEYTSHIMSVLANVKEVTEHQVAYLVSRFEEEWMKLWGSEKSGKLYKRGKSGKVHRASAAGEPPASDSGRLKASFKSSVVITGDGVEGHIGIAAGSNVDYARYLEYGTEKMAPRPLWRPALDAIKQDVKDL